MQLIKIVLDTSIFVNPDSHFLFGKTPKDAFFNFLDILEDKKHISCFIPPSVYEELIKFIESAPAAKKIPLIAKKPPSSYETTVPSLLMYEFIEEMRLRINKGLRIAEKYARKRLKDPGGDNREAEEQTIKTLRQEYRAALRE